MAVLHRLYIEKLGASSVSSFVGSYGDIFYDPATITLRISDGTTPGGRLLVGGSGAATSAADITVSPAGTITTATVQAALNELDAKKLAVAGGTMTGELVLDGNAPVDPNAAVSKGFVEGFVADTIANGDIAGNNIVFDNSTTTLTATDLQGAVAELDAVKLDKSGGALTGAVTTTQTTFAANELVSRDFVETIINTEDTFVDTIGFDSGTGILNLVNTDGTAITASGWDSRYLQLTGGTLTGDLIINAPSTDANSVATNSYVSNYVTNVINTGGIDSNTIVFDGTTTTLTSNTVQGAIAELDANKVDRAGDTMAGYLTLYADPIAPLHAVTKDYVDSAVTAGSGASLLNDLLDVNAVAPTDGATLRYDSGLTRWVLGSHVDTAGDTMTGFLTLNADPTAALHAATKQYVDTSAAAAVAAVVDTAPATLDTLNELAAALGDDENFATTMTTSLAEKVSLAGDTMTGYLNLHADPTFATHAANKAYVDAQAGAVVLNDLTDVYAGSPVDGNFLMYSTDIGGNWLSTTPRITSIADVNFTTTPATGEVLAFDGTDWVNTVLPTGVNEITDLQDVNIPSFTPGFILQIDGTGNVTAGGVALDGLSDVATTGAASGEVLTFDGSGWVPTALPAGTTDTFTANGAIDSAGLITFTKSDLSTYDVDISSYAPSLGDLTDVTITNPSNITQTLKYFNGTWMNMDDGVNIASNSASIDMGVSFVPTGSSHSTSVLYNYKLLFNPTTGALTVDGETITAAKIQAWDAAPAAINDLTDVDTTGLIENGAQLLWNTTASKWTQGWTNVVQSNSTVLDNEYDVILKSQAAVSSIYTDSDRGVTYNPSSNTLSVGIVSLAADPTTALQAATKQYVDSAAAETVTSLSLAANVLTYTDEAGANTALDLSLYLDDTNLARLTSGTVAANGTATFTRDDATTFDIDMSVLLDTNTDALVDLTDTNVGAVTDGQVLTWDNATSMWVGTTPETIASGTITGQELMWNGTAWTPAPPAGARALINAADDTAAAALFAPWPVSVNASNPGLRYFNTTTNKLRIWDGTAWADVGGEGGSDYYIDSYPTGNAVYPESDGTLPNGSIYYNEASQLHRVKKPSGWSNTGDVYNSSSVGSSTLTYFKDTSGKNVGSVAGWYWSASDRSLAAGNDYYLKYNALVAKNSSSRGISVTEPNLTWGVSYHKRTASAALTFAFTDPGLTTLGSSETWSMTVELDLNGGSVTWPANVKWPNATAPSLTDQKKHLLMFSTSDGGVTILGSYLTDYDR